MFYVQCIFAHKEMNLKFTHYTVSYPPPTEIILSEVNRGQLTFSWTPVSNNCSALHYSTISSNCGECPSSTTSSSVNCSKVILKKKTYICSFAVIPVTCGNTLGMASKPIALLIEGMVQCKCAPQHY